MDLRIRLRLAIEAFKGALDKGVWNATMNKKTIQHRTEGTMKHPWVALHAKTLEDVRTRWASSPDSTIDPLNKESRWNDAAKTWRVTSALELHQLVGALQWLNPDLQLWFRGEGTHYPSSLPSRYRPGGDSDGPSLATKAGRAHLNKHAHLCRSLRDREQFARLAILQHYGCPTSFLDVTKSVDVAAAFAFENHASAIPAEPSKEIPHIRIYALPRHNRPITTFDLADCVLVDLEAELPSYCLRPHVQHGGFIARTSGALYDLEQADVPNAHNITLDGHCVGHVALAIADGYRRFYEPKQDLLYPRRTAGSAAGKLRANATGGGDYLLSLLRDIADHHEAFKFRHGGKEKEFPDNFARDR